MTQLRKLLKARPDLKVCEVLDAEQCAMCVDEDGECVRVTILDGKLVTEIQ